MDENQYTTKLFSGNVGAQDGSGTAPSPFAGPPGWTVFKQGQTEIYQIRHGLNLKNPQHDLHVVVSVKEHSATAIVERVETDTFTISTWGTQTPATPTPRAVSFMFIAAYHPS